MDYELEYRVCSFCGIGKFGVLAKSNQRHCSTLCAESDSKANKNTEDGKSSKTIFHFGSGRVETKGEDCYA